MLSGGIGMDTLIGGAQRDVLDGGADNDTLDGGAREDELDGGTGMDMLTGGTQADLFILHADQTAADADTITDFERNLDTIRIDGAGLANITFTQSGLDTEIAADGVLVATVLNATAADVMAQTTISIPPPPPAATSSAASFTAQSVGNMMVLSSDDPAFEFNDMATGPISTTSYGQTKVPLTELFDTSAVPVLSDLAIDRTDKEDNPWLEHSSFGFEPLA